MGKPTGFLEVERSTIPARPALERIKDWREGHEKRIDKGLQKQASRCMDCGTPFCHTGLLFGGMASGCPINNLIPEFNDLVYRGRWEEALERLRMTNNFPEFTGRVCPAPCEGSCTLGVIDPPVTIKNIEKTIIDRGWEEGWLTPRETAKKTSKKIAVVGSGPAGLSCAEQLNLAGHEVTVFERADRPGGLLMYGIPNMKLDKKEIVERRIRLMEEEGVQFVCNANIGEDSEWTRERLNDEFDSVALCCGATKPNDFLAGVEGRDASGIHMAMEFLTDNTKALLDHGEQDKAGKPKGVNIDAEGRDVVVIGGGDTGTDCVGTSIRHGCKSVVQLEILPKPPEERAADNPWPEWPKVYKMDYGQEEAAAVFGDDPRVYSVNTERFIKDKEGNLSALEIIDIEWQPNPEGGRPLMVKLEETRREIPCQLALFALGFSGPEQGIIKKFDLETDPRSNVKAEFEKYTTNVEGIFACGDMRRGQSLVVWAINEGRGCAREIDRFLMGETMLP